MQWNKLLIPNSFECDRTFKYFKEISVIKISKKEEINKEILFKTPLEILQVLDDMKRNLKKHLLDTSE